VRDSSGAPFVGMVWPGLTVFPDFADPRAIDYWLLMWTQVRE
jgi:alpha-glucosidase (family GH31 glycosyl hydrolase)